MNKKLKIFVLLWLLFSSYLKAQNNVALPPDSGMVTLNTSAQSLIIPDKLQQYSGIRFVDVRYFKDFLGFIASKNGKQTSKLKTIKNLEEELNQAKREYKKEPVTTDSIFIVIKNCWFNKSSYENHLDFCNMSALFFIKQKDSFYYDYKIDTSFAYKDLFGDFYKTCIDKVMNDLMKLYIQPGKNLSKQYAADVFYANVQKKRPGIKPVTDSMGIFLTYKDFLNGNLYKAPFNVTPFLEQFTFRIENEELNSKLHKTIWGLVYQGNLYIKNNNFLSRAFPVGETYITKCNVVIEGNGHIFAPAIPYNRSVNDADQQANDVANTVLMATTIIDLIHHKKARVESYPAILNIETGKLE